MLKTIFYCIFASVTPYQGVKVNKQLTPTNPHQVYVNTKKPDFSPPAVGTINI